MGDQENNNHVQNGMKSVGVAIVFHDKILLLHHPHDENFEGTLSIPKGRQEEGEVDIMTAIREVKEEVGINIPATWLSIAPRHTLTTHEGREIVYYTIHIELLKQIGMYSDTVNPMDYQREEVNWAGFMDKHEAMKNIHPDQRVIISTAFPDIRFDEGGSANDFENTERNSKFTEITKDEIIQIISGKIGSSTGDVIKSATRYLRANEGANAKGIEKSGDIIEQETSLKQFITDNNLWYPHELSEDSKYYLGEGMEQEVYSFDSLEKVTKINPAFSYQSWEEYLNSLTIHNHLFSETKYTLVGFLMRQNKLFAIVEQPFISETSIASDDDAYNFMINRGFVNVGYNDYYNKELGLEIKDLHIGNVLVKNDILYFIDTIIKIKQESEESQHEDGGETYENWQETRESVTEAPVIGKFATPFHNLAKTIDSKTDGKSEIFTDPIGKLLKGRSSNESKEDGGIIEGQLHAECNDEEGCGEKFDVGDGGKVIEAERDEAVIVSEIQYLQCPSGECEYQISGTPSEIASAINVLGGGKNFDDGAKVADKEGNAIKEVENKPEAKDTDVDRKLESGSIIINRKSMYDKNKYLATGTAKEIASVINSLNDNGVVIEHGGTIAKV
jgi:8-oxo-dGTP pyrophosphatase MutT (NUDIX family)